MTKLQTILVTGCAGQLGQSIQYIAAGYPDFDFIFANRQSLDLNDETSITKFFKNQTFDIIVNCAAYTAVDKAEAEPELANQINYLAVQKLSRIVKEHGSKLIHISTDYVFSGKQYRPYLETDEVEPQGVYGKTKLYGENYIKSILKTNAIIIRTSWIYSEYGNNFVKTILKLGREHDTLNVIFDQVGTPTYAEDLAKSIMCIIESQSFNQEFFKTDIVNYSNEGVCSWYDFAKTIFELTNTQCIVLPVETKDYPTPAKRPHYSVLNKTKIKKTYHLTIPYWKDSLRLCLTALLSRAS
jgi:dTDP-4-dehydrorhamnose reductase|tara:strand:+ start:2564 stop:3457 length:894 start_codon:yes stop_codon:yes gene_type:complete